MQAFDKKNSPTGSLRISKDVIATIAAAAAVEIAGVADLAAGSGDFAGWVIKKQTAKPVAISLSEDVAVIDLRIILKHTAVIRSVCEKIQISVKEAVQNMTGIAVSKVNVTVAGIDFSAAEPSAAPESAKVCEPE